MQSSLSLYGDDRRRRLWLGGGAGGGTHPTSSDLGEDQIASSRVGQLLCVFHTGVFSQPLHSSAGKLAGTHPLSSSIVVVAVEDLVAVAYLVIGMSRLYVLAQWLFVVTAVAAQFTIIPEKCQVTYITSAGTR